MSDINQLSVSELKEEIRRREQAKKDERKAYKNLVQQELPKNIELLKHLSQKIAEVKTEIFSNMTTLVEMKTAIFGVKSDQQSHTFSIDNGDTLKIGYRVIDAWDDTVNEGIAKVNEYISSLAKDEDTAKLVRLVNNLLKKDAKGNLRANRVVELRNLADELNSELFTDGVEIISQAYKPVRSAYFIDAYEIDSVGVKRGIPLSVSSVDFTKELNLKF